ncbi:hypothetical protein HRG_013117 [Hirsutella rhossiliensis]
MPNPSFATSPNHLVTLKYCRLIFNDNRRSPPIRNALDQTAPGAEGFHQSRSLNFAFLSAKIRFRWSVPFCKSGFA